MLKTLYICYIIIYKGSVNFIKYHVKWIKLSQFSRQSNTQLFGQCLRRLFVDIPIENCGFCVSDCVSDCVSLLGEVSTEAKITHIMITLYFINVSFNFQIFPSANYEKLIFEVKVINKVPVLHIITISNFLDIIYSTLNFSRYNISLNG